jgi:MIP family channel proteins
VAEQPWWRPATAELIGVFALVFLGAGSVVTLARLNAAHGGGEDGLVLVGGALAHGLAIAVMVTALGHISGGHFNPAVTLAAMATRRIAPPLGLVYIAAQLVGGVVGAVLLVSTVPANWWQAVKLATPAVPTGIEVVDPFKAVLAEAVLTFFLVIVIFGAAMDQRHPNWGVAGFAIGLTITAGILMGAFLTGAAMNPARAFATALVGDQMTRDQYVYWVGPIVGGVLGGLVYDLAFVQNKLKPSPIPPAPEPESPAPPAPPSEPPLSEPGTPPMM